MKHFPIKCPLFALLILAVFTGCSHGQRNDHYYCNDRASLEEYEACMTAGKEIERAEREDLL